MRQHSDVLADDVAGYVRSLARSNGVTYVPTPEDAFAATASRLVGDGLAAPDETEDLLVALYRAGVVSEKEQMSLLVRHLEQRS
ncbi:MAG: hypothetical protein ABWY78_10820, partial [Microvirga sp.]